MAAESIGRSEHAATTAHVPCVPATTVFASGYVSTAARTRLAISPAPSRDVQKTDSHTMGRNANPTPNPAAATVKSTADDSGKRTLAGPSALETLATAAMENTAAFLPTRKGMRRCTTQNNASSTHVDNADNQRRSRNGSAYVTGSGSAKHSTVHDWHIAKPKT